MAAGDVGLGDGRLDGERQIDAGARFSKAATAHSKQRQGEAGNEQGPRVQG